MATCLKCFKNFPNWVKINGKNRNLCNRKYCLECSPFKSHNVKKIHIKGSEIKKPHSRDYSSFSEEEKKDFLQNQYKDQKEKRFKRKIALVKEKGGCCELCGYNKNLSCLTFHHKNPSEKLFTLDIRTMASRSFAELEEEAKKCSLLCHNCHHEYHNPDLNNWDI